MPYTPKQRRMLGAAASGKKTKSGITKKTARRMLKHSSPVKDTPKYQAKGRK